MKGLGIAYNGWVTTFIRKTVAVFCCLALAACCAGGCRGQEVEPTYVSPYDWKRLAYEDGRFSYTKEGVPASRIGIDVSDHQGIIDWEMVEADGIDFAMIRLGYRGFTEGNIYLDEQYEANLKEARSAGILVGVYFFSQAINEKEAREEADFVIKNLEGVKLDYPIVYDHEPVTDAQGRANKLSNRQLTRNAQAFCERIQEAGYTPMIYGNNADISRLDLKALGTYEFWFAEYDTSKPSGQFDFTMWQYTNNGSVAGIDTRVDMNIHFLAP